MMLFRSAIWMAIFLLLTAGASHAIAQSQHESLAQRLTLVKPTIDAERDVEAIAVQHGTDSTQYANAIVHLAELLSNDHRQIRKAEVEAFLRKALDIRERHLGRDDESVGKTASRLASHLRFQDRWSEAEPLVRRALAIHEAKHGPSSAHIVEDLKTLVAILLATNRTAEAEPLMLRAVANEEKAYGTAQAAQYDELALLYAQKGSWVQARQIYERGRVAMTGREYPGFGTRSDQSDAQSVNRWGLRSFARTLNRLDPTNPDVLADSFELAQMSMRSPVAIALERMSARFAKGSGALAALARQREELVEAVATREDVMRIMRSIDDKLFIQVFAEWRELQSKLAAVERQLKDKFGEYTDLRDPPPMTIPAVQALLQSDQAVLVFAHVSSKGTLAEETLVWAITQNDVRSNRISTETRSLSDRITGLRCGLDNSNWRVWETERRERCKQLLGVEASDTDTPPFDLGMAHELHEILLGPFADLTEGKQLLVVLSGPLTTLPFHVLVTAKPDPSLSGSHSYAQAKWLVLKQPVTVLPSIGSLHMLRRLGTSQATKPYLAFGNPLLDGDGSSIQDERARNARTRQKCPQDLETLRQRTVATVKNIPGLGVLVRGDNVDLSEMRRQLPLPETTDEVCAVGKSLNALGNEGESIWLGDRATESNIKNLSQEGKLAQYRILHFATHGLLSGESELIHKSSAQPALMLTPPHDGKSRTELKNDNGLLTESEVANLELDADWVVLSACNTAGGRKSDAEALGGLARAFFYAGARALLVSHWYVNSDAAVKIITRTFAELRTNPRTGRAEALRRSMVALMTSGEFDNAHPANWAPFTLVGGNIEGNVSRSP